MPINKHDLLTSLPLEWSHDVLPEIRRRLRESGQKVVVLDDDPTGTQTVHGVPVLTEWSVASLRAELQRDQPAFYILTNTRAMTPERARAVNAEIARNLSAVQFDLMAPRRPLGGPLTGRFASSHGDVPPAGRGATILSRSDSTLRGHFPIEVDALRTERTAHAPTLLVPAFFAGGRYTIGDVHYVAYGDELVPAGETEFAKDAAFGYRASNLREWVEEKTNGRVKAADVASISIKDVRIGGPERVLNSLVSLAPDSVCIVNAAAESDLEVVALASLMCEANGKPLLYRTAASFARARAGINQKPLLTNIETRRSASLQNGGLIVVGSYVPKTSGQLDALLQTGIDAIEANVEALLNNAIQQQEIARVAEQANRLIVGGYDVVIYTSRRLITGSDATTSLAIGNRVSDSLIAIVRDIAAQPRYVLAKGGITSSDVATQALNVKRAMVLGQLLPGVPVWQLGPESRMPNAIYVVFPGNVGGQDALAEAWRSLKR